MAHLKTFTADHLEAVAIGAGILGTGGGGSPYLAKLQARDLLRGTAGIEVVQPDDLPDNAVIVATGGVGAPTISIERIKQGEEFLNALRALEAWTGKRATHMISAEIGGGNAISPVIVAAQAGLAVVDGDGMGRAFPELQMDTFSISGVPPTPYAIADIRGHTVVYDHLADATALERYVRTVTIQMGGSSGGSGPMMSAAEIRRAAIPGTLTLAVRLGEAVLEARARHDDPVEAAIARTGGRLLCAGKIVDLDRRFVAGFNRGTITLDGLDADAGLRVSIDFQNENLIARDDAGAVLCSVPDLICVVETETADPISTELLRYGLRVSVIGIPAPTLLKTPEALAVVGPVAFGYHDVEFHPLPGEYGCATSSRLSGTA